MKRILALCMSLVLSVAIFASCGKATPVDVKVLALKGPTAMGMVEFMDGVSEGKITDNKYDFKITATVDEVAPKLTKGEVDIAAIPANLASVLENKTGKVQVLAVNTLGVLNICEAGNTIKTVKDLKGKTIFASGKGASPEFALNYILKKNGLDPTKDVNIQWKSEHAECVTAMAQSKDGVAMLPQPFATVAQMKAKNIRIALDLTKAWDEAQKGDKVKSSMITGVIVARKDFVEKNPDAVKAFLENYQKSVDYVNDNVEDAAKLVSKFDIVPTAVAEKAIPKCNIVCITGKDMKEKLSGYLNVLKEQNPKAIGGKLPGDEFYYEK